MAPILVCLFSVFGFCISYEDTPVFFRWISDVSYFRACFHSLAYSTYSTDSPELYCPPEKVYCYFSYPGRLLNMMGIYNINLWFNALFVITITFVMFLVTYFSLSIRVNKR